MASKEELDVEIEETNKRLLEARANEANQNEIENLQCSLNNLYDLQQEAQ